MKCTYELLLVPPSWLFAITSGVHVYIWLPCWHQGNVMLYMCMQAYYISCITKYIKLICMCVYVKKVRIHVYLYRKNWYDDVVNSMLMMHSLQKNEYNDMFIDIILFSFLSQYHSMTMWEKNWIWRDICHRIHICDTSIYTFLFSFQSYCHTMTMWEKTEYDEIFAIAYTYMICLSISSYSVSRTLSQYNNVRGNWIRCVLM